MCSNVPTLIDGKQYEQCHKGMKGKKGKKMGGAGSSEEVGASGKGGGDAGYDRPESDVAPGEGQLEAMTAPRRGKREPRRGGML